MIRWIILAFLILLLLAAGYIVHQVFMPVVLPGEAPTQVIIEKGATTAEIAGQLDERELIRSPRLFRWLARAWGIDRRLKPGRYDFAGSVSTYEILESLYHQDAVRVKITIPDGWRVTTVARFAQRQLGVDSARFLELCRDSLFLNQLAVPVGNAEGYLLTDTYRFYWGVEPEEFIRALVVMTHRVFVDSLMKRMNEIGWSKHKTLTMASLIEAEAGVAEERTRISGVFHNRLRRNMKLQCDPTVIYALGGINRRLLYRDLKIDSPYNTYKYRGLPPGPICNVGIPAITAALYPDEHNELYFVARGDGTHIFSESLREHNRARRLVKQLRQGAP